MKRVVFLTTGLSLALGLLVGCSPNSEQANKVPEGEHVWKNQTQTIDRARNVEQTLQIGADQKKLQIEESSR
jgi:outer membrane biogenesis lipoprotein LolB